MRRLSWIGVLVAVALRAGMAAESYNPYKISKEQFAARVHVIALEPVLLPHGLPQPDAVRKRIAELVTSKLTARGYRVVSAAEYDAVWRDMARRLGGLFDPATGKPDVEKVKAAAQHTNRELAHRHDADATLVVAVYLKDLSMDVGPGLWGGFSLYGQPLLWHGEKLSDRPQKVVGTNMNLTIRDLDGDELYGVAFPIEWVSLYALRGHDEIPKDHWLTDTARLQHAVDTDLDPLPSAGTAR